MAKEKQVNLNEIDANFIISSFKNKDRRNNPNSKPRPLLPPEKKNEEDVVEETTELEEKPKAQSSNIQSREGGRKRKGQSKYRETFMRRNEIKFRESVYISHTIHEKIVRLIRVLEDSNITIGGYIDLVLSEHLEQHREEINEIYRESQRREDLI